MQEWLDKCVRLGNGGVFIGWLTTMVWLSGKDGRNKCLV